MCIGLSIGGCGVPFATPPVRTAVGMGYGLGAIGAPPDARSEAPTYAHGPVMTFRAALHPMQWFPALERRPVDVGAGYLLELDLLPGHDAFTKHGTYLDFTSRPVAIRLDQKRWFRIEVDTMLELMIADIGRGTEFGPGVTFIVSAGVGGFVKGGFARNEANPDYRLRRLRDPKSDLVVTETVRYGTKRSSLGGVGWGEGFAGLYVSTSYRHIHDETYWVLSCGLTFRLPAAVGAYFWF